VTGVQPCALPIFDNVRGAEEVAHAPLHILFACPEENLVVVVEVGKQLQKLALEGIFPAAGIIAQTHLAKGPEIGIRPGVQIELAVQGSPETVLRLGVSPKGTGGPEAEVVAAPQIQAVLDQEGLFRCQGTFVHLQLHQEVAAEKLIKINCPACPRQQKHQQYAQQSCLPHDYPPTG